MKPVIKRFTQALYKETCPSCIEHLQWEADFDADGTTYTAHCCGIVYTMFPHTVRIEQESE